jgi:hypothetical protein
VAGRPTGDHTLRLTLDIDTRTQPISGRITSDKRQWQFSGWLELAVALQAAITEQSTGEWPDHPP